MQTFNDPHSLLAKAHARIDELQREAQQDRLIASIQANQPQQPSRFSSLLQLSFAQRWQTQPSQLVLEVATRPPEAQEGVT